MKLKCDQGCTREFQVEKIQTRKVDEKVEQRYFTCSFCGQEYTSYYSNSLVKELQAQVRELSQQYNQSRDRKQKRALERLIKKVQAKMKKEMHTLAKQFAPGSAGALEEVRVRVTPKMV